MKTIWFLFLIIISKAAFSQPLPPPVPQSWYPIDTVVALLLVVGVVWGVKKLKNKSRSVAT